MRPHYEKAVDRENARKTAQVVANWLGISGIELPENDPADYRFGDLFVEIKTRGTPRARHPTLFVSATKKARNEALKRPTLLVVAWTDCTGAVSIHKPNFYGDKQGRVDRGDRYDLERMAHFDIERFRLIA